MQRRGRWSIGAALLVAHSLPCAAGEVRPARRPDTTAPAAAAAPAASGKTTASAKDGHTAAPEDRAPSAPAPKATLRAFDPSQVSERMARLDSAEVYYAWGDFAAVVRVLSQPVATRPRAQVLLGWSYYRLERFDAAVQAFDSGLQVAPDHLDLMNGHAFALYRTGQAAAAEAEFRRLLERAPEREESVRGLAAVLFTSQRFAECLPLVDKLLRDRPGEQESTHQLMKSVDGMLSAWRAEGRTPADMVAEGWRLAEGGNRRSAVEIFRWVLLVDPFHPSARLGLGTLGPEFGYDSEARRCLDELLHENPNDSAARAQLARLHLAAGRVQEAGKEVDVLLANQPNDPQGLELRRAMREQQKGTKP